jgi:SNF2 family DNA or RNA helicase
MAGLASDSTTHQVAQQVRTSMMLSNKMAPFMQRRGVSFLTRDLPPSQTVVLYIRQSKLQARLYRSFEKYAKGLKGSNKLSFIAHYQMLRPLHNHPTCLLEQAKAKSIHKNVSAKQKEKKSVLAASVNVKAELKGNKQRNNTKEIVDLTEVLNDHIEGESGWNSSLGMFQESLPLGDKKDMEYSWMDRILAKTTETAFTSVKNGYKIFLLLQILANANCLGDKVVVFSQCLKTLDFIETVLNTHDWARFCKGFESDKTLGSWRKGADYLRIDGSVNASVRGDLVSSFHQTVGGVKVFLLSIEAGGIGYVFIVAPFC